MVRFVDIGQVDEPLPEFLEPLENHTVTQGRDVYFTCVVNHLSSYKVAWIKSDSKAILAIHTHMIAQNSRLSVTHNGHNTWKLHISNVQKNDSGTYMCQINTVPMKYQMGHLSVVIPPDILSDNDSVESGNEGDTVRLRCKATGSPEPKVMWRREDGRSFVLRHENREKQVLKLFDGDTLVLRNIHRTDMGAYLCIASNGIPPTVSKRFIVKVQFPPSVKVPNQLVAAPLDSDVALVCYVEASPKAMNQWIRNETDERLLPSNKYLVTETAVSDYTYSMNLTIIGLERKDFGNYVCRSSNGIATSEGSIRLQELNFMVKSSTTTSTPRYIADTKPRKAPPKEKSKKWKKKHKKGSDGDFDDETSATTAALPPHLGTFGPPRLSIPSTNKPPTWIRLSNSGSKNAKFSVLLFLINFFCFNDIMSKLV